MTPKHTPGPWQVGKWDGKLVITDKNNCIVSTMQWQIKDEERANARLIAASPDLLKTCKSIVRMILGYMEDRRTFSDTLIEKAQQVIDRTEGKENGNDHT